MAMKADHDSKALARQGGFTIVEMTIATFLFLGVIVLTYSATTTVTKYNQRNEAEFDQEMSYRHVLDQLRDDLRQSTTERDPRTNLPRYQILTDGSGRKSLSFQKLVGATTVNGEISPRWSSAIVISYDDKGYVYRTQDNKSVVIGSGVESMDFVKTPEGKFGVMVVTPWRDPETGVEKDVSHDMFVRPLN